jgi:hypothetical protein
MNSKQAGRIIEQFEAPVYHSFNVALFKRTIEAKELESQVCQRNIEYFQVAPP